MLQARHVHRLSSTNLLQDLVVLIRREHTDETHHPLHKSTPTWSETIVLRSLDHLVHRHHWTFHAGVLWKPGDTIRIAAHFHAAVLHARHVVLHTGHR